MPNFHIEEALLREPNLWVPGKKPVGNVEIDWSNDHANNLQHFFMYQGWRRVVDFGPGKPGSYGAYGSHTNVGTVYGSGDNFGSTDTSYDRVYVNDTILPITSSSKISFLFHFYVNRQSNIQYIANVYISSSVRIDIRVESTGGSPANTLGFFVLMGSGFTFETYLTANAISANGSFVTAVLAADIAAKRGEITALIDGKLYSSGNTGTGANSTSITGTYFTSRYDRALSQDQTFDGIMLTRAHWNRKIESNERSAIVKDPYQLLIPA
jgi:hypothetical protein